MEGALSFESPRGRSRPLDGKTALVTGAGRGERIDILANVAGA
jgi:hypothetical protein